MRVADAHFAARRVTNSRPCRPWSTKRRQSKCESKPQAAMRETFQFGLETSGTYQVSADNSRTPVPIFCTSWKKKRASRQEHPSNRPLATDIYWRSQSLHLHVEQQRNNVTATKRNINQKVCDRTFRRLRHWERISRGRQTESAGIHHALVPA